MTNEGTIIIPKGIEGAEVLLGEVKDGEKDVGESQEKSRRKERDLHP